MSNYFFRPKLRDLTIGARLEFARKFRYLDEKNVVEELMPYFDINIDDISKNINEYTKDLVKGLNDWKEMKEKTWKYQFKNI